MKRRNVQGCDCCGAAPCPGALCITVQGCASALPGASVVLSLAGTTIASGTTDGSGRICFNYPSAATYTITITATGYQTKTTTFAADCTNQSVTIAPLTPSAGFGCCFDTYGSSAPAWPDTLTLTDNGITVTLTGTGCQWSGSRAVSPPILAGCPPVVGSTIGYILTLSQFGVSTANYVLEVAWSSCQRSGTTIQDWASSASGEIEIATGGMTYPVNLTFTYPMDFAPISGPGTVTYGNRPNVGPTITITV